MINKSGTKMWMDIYNKPKISKRYASFTSNHIHHFVKPRTSFSVARRKCTIVENQNVKEKRFKELEKTLLEQKCPR